jgi:hypothetical protein
MSETLVNLLIQAIAGAICGNVAGGAVKDVNLGMIWEHDLRSNWRRCRRADSRRVGSDAGQWLERTWMSARLSAKWPVAELPARFSRPWSG